MTEKIISERFSFKGWKLKEWFLGNWQTIKELGKVGAPLVIGWLATRSLPWTGFVTVLGKFILDSGEYWFKQYKA